VKLTLLASQTLTVLSLEAVYKMPLSIPPHLTTFTDAVWPPRVYSTLRLVTDHTRTVPSLEEEAKRGDEFLKAAKIRTDSTKPVRRGFTYRCIGSHAKDIIHLVCPLRASPIGLPVLGSHRRTYEQSI
jgi:hypothetical protein